MAWLRRLLLIASIVAVLLLATTTIALAGHTASGSRGPGDPPPTCPVLPCD